MRVRARAIAVMLAGLWLASGLAACAPVAPWRRGRLAHPAMSDTPDPAGAAFEGHLRGAREAALDPASAGGGGCGCN
jgi:hypothetical protein